ncbi:MAG: hypothetical protein L3J33_10260 [Rhodobacteraceae bacterium]|nr:hypothetical protein [Paracoccaceae bacterium]
MRNLYRTLFMVFLLGFGQTATAQAIVGRAAIDGQIVVLFDDQTWGYEDESAGNCDQFHAVLSFCDPDNIWQTSRKSTPDVVAAYKYDDRHYSQFIIEGIGRADGLDQESLRKIIISNAATAAGIPESAIAILDIFDTEISGYRSETVVYELRIGGLNAVFANTLILEENFIIQAMTYSIGSGYSDKHQELQAYLIENTKIELPE